MFKDRSNIQFIDMRGNSMNCIPDAPEGEGKSGWTFNDNAQEPDGKYFLGDFEKDKKSCRSEPLEPTMAPSYAPGDPTPEPTKAPTSNNAYIGFNIMSSAFLIMTAG